MLGLSKKETETELGKVLVSYALTRRIEKDVESKLKSSLNSLNEGLKDPQRSLKRLRIFSSFLAVMFVVNQYLFINYECIVELLIFCLECVIAQPLKAPFHFFYCLAWTADDGSSIYIVKTFGFEIYCGYIFSP